MAHKRGHGAGTSWVWAHILALLIFASVTFRGVSGTCHHEFYNGTYGDVKTGAALYAPLLGVTCSEECHEKAARWGGAYGGNNDVVDPLKCAELCANNVTGCEVWSHRPSSRSCEYKQRLVSEKAGPVLAQHDTAVSRPASCDDEWLPLLDGLAYSAPEIVNPCFQTDKTYGEAKAGSCKDAAVLYVLGSQRTIDLGVRNGWWDEEQTFAFNNIGMTDCQAFCSRNYDIFSRCGGFTFLSLDDGTEVCLLKEAIDCLPALGDRVGAIAGFNSTCNKESEVLEPWFSDCEKPRCTQLHSKGLFLQDQTFAPDHQCHYHMGSNEEVRSCLADKWVLVSGGSNSILFYLNWVNQISPGLLHTHREGIRTGRVTLVDTVVSAAGQVIYMVSVCAHAPRFRHAPQYTTLAD